MTIYVVFDNDRMLSAWKKTKKAADEVARLISEAEIEYKRNGQYNGHYFYFHPVTLK